MRRNLTIAAIISGLVGCCFGLMAAWKIEHMFTENSISLGWGKAHSGFWWDHALLLSFAFGSLAFILELVAVLSVPSSERREGGSQEI
jgi:hypothetical protein